MLKKQFYISHLIAVGTMVLFLTGCFTQIRTVSKTSANDYEVPQEQSYTAEDQQPAESTETIEDRPITQYNFYGWSPDPYDFYYSPFYSGINLHFGSYDPWYYDPFVWEPWYVNSVYVWNPYRAWGGFHHGYHDYYNPYWDYDFYPYDHYVVAKPQKRRDFEPRRGLEQGDQQNPATPYIPSFAAGSKDVSRIERIKKDRMTTENPTVRTGNNSTERTRKVVDENTPVISTMPIRKVTSERRSDKPTTSDRVGTSEGTELSRPRAIGNRTENATTDKRSTATKSRTPKKESQNQRRTKPTRTTSPPTERSGSSNGAGERSYKPKTSNPTPSATPRSSGSTKPSSSSNSGSKGSSSRTKKDR